MKKLAFVLAGAFLSVSTMGAMAYTDNMAIESKYDGKKTKVQKEELPQEIIQSLEDGQYKDWEIQEAYKVEDEMSNEVHYELHMASAMDAETVRNVKFNKSGEIVEDSELGRTEDQQFEQTEPSLDQPQQDQGLEQQEDLDQQEIEPGLDQGTEQNQGQY